MGLSSRPHSIGVRVSVVRESDSTDTVFKGEGPVELSRESVFGGTDIWGPPRSVVEGTLLTV